MIQMTLKKKYRPNGSHYAKKIGINGDHSTKSTRRKQQWSTPISRQRIMILDADQKIRWEDV